MRDTEMGCAICGDKVDSKGVETEEAQAHKDCLNTAVHA